MEAIGTPMGGGALKLEATHLRRLPLPTLSSDELRRITHLATEIMSDTGAVSKVLNEIDRITVSSILFAHADEEMVDGLISNLRQTAGRLQQARQRR